MELADLEKMIGSYGSIPFVVLFYSNSCAPCRRALPVLEEIKDKHRNIKTIKLLISDVPELAGKLGVYKVPHAFVFNKGEKLSYAGGNAIVEMEADLIDKGIL